MAYMVRLAIIASVMVKVTTKLRRININWQQEIFYTHLNRVITGMIYWASSDIKCNWNSPCWKNMEARSWPPWSPALHFICQIPQTFHKQIPPIRTSFMIKRIFPRKTSKTSSSKIKRYMSCFQIYNRLTQAVNIPGRLEIA